MKNNLLAKRYLLAFCTIATMYLWAFAPLTVQAGDTPDSPAVIIYDNGPFQTGSTTKSGVAAPAGAQWSEVQNNFGDTTAANTSGGLSCSLTATEFRCADDFIVPGGQTWTINQVIVYIYQTGFAGTTGPVTSANLRIWNGRPGDPGATVIFGDTTTNRLASQTDTNTFRVFNTVAPPPGSAPGTTRRIWQVNINVAPAVVLTSGNYWIDWQTGIAANGAHFAPTTTIVNTRGAIDWNARQFNGTSWVDITDDGAPATAPDYLQDFPFKLDGTIAGAPAIPRRRTMDFNGDNRSDYVVARAANATSPATWWIQPNTTAGTPGYAVQWGTGVGLSGGDVAVPEDYDGDGRTDVAVWRANAGGTGRGFFYILRSSNNTFRSEQFGAPGDDPTVVDDYDGDGTADLAVYRASGSGTTASCGSSSAWYWRPSATAGVDFRTICWGTAADKPYPGDYDGDGRADASVIRNSSGNAVHFVNGTTAGNSATFFGAFTDRFVTGDFDGDFRTDRALVRNVGGAYFWYIVMSASGRVVQTQVGNAATDYIAPGDYDGDNRMDIAIWRSGQAADQTYFFVYPMHSSAPMAAEWGQSAGSLTPPDYPVAAFQVH